MNIILNEIVVKQKGSQPNPHRLVNRREIQGVTAISAYLKMTRAAVNKMARINNMNLP
jgi:hypothetical protein